MRQLEISKELVEFYRGKNKMSITTFCKECGITRNTYDKIMSNEKCNVLSVLRIARRMDISLKEIYPPWSTDDNDCNTSNT